MQTKHIWDCHKQSQAPVIWNFMSFQLLHLHEPLRDELSQRSFTLQICGLTQFHQLAECPCTAGIFGRRFCIVWGIRVLVSVSNAGVFSISKGGVDHEDEVGLRAQSLELVWYYSIHLGNFYTAHEFSKNCSRNIKTFIFDPVWRALQTVELFIATHAILFCGERRHIDLDGVHWHQEEQFIVQLTTPDSALY